MAVFSFRRNGTITTTDWHLDLNASDVSSREEAQEIAEAAFDLRHAIREVLLARCAQPTIH